MFRADLKQWMGGRDRTPGRMGEGRGALEGASAPGGREMRFRAAFVTLLMLTSGACAVVDAREDVRRERVRYEDDVPLFYDDEVECYRVRDHDGYFFDDGYFYRFSDGEWY